MNDEIRRMISLDRDSVALIGYAFVKTHQSIVEVYFHEKQQEGNFNVQVTERTKG